MKIIYKVAMTIVTVNLVVMVHAQTTVIQDTKGESALDLGTRGVVAVNAKDESISFSWSKSLADSTKLDRNGNQRALNNLSYVGISVQGKGKNGIFNALKEGDFQYDGSIGPFFTYSRLPGKDWKYGYLQVNVAASYIFSQLKLFDTTLAYTGQVFNKNESGYKLSINANWYPESRKLPFIVGVALNGGQKNNAAELVSADVADYSLIVDPVTNKQRLVAENKVSAYSTASYRGNLAYFNFNVDFGPQLFKQFLLLGHSRWSVQAERKPQWNPAVGLYVTKKGAPLEAVAGIQVQILDYFNTAALLKSRQERTVVNLVAGFTF